MTMKIRVPSTTVELIQMLGTIIREHIKIKLWDIECWTFEYTANWEIPMKPPAAGAPEHEMSIYLGSGYCMAFGSSPRKAERLDLKVRCEHSKWIPTSLSYWDFQIWMKFPAGSVERHHFVCHLGYGDERDIHPETLCRMPQQPPKKIAFWQPN